MIRQLMLCATGMLLTISDPAGARTRPVFRDGSAPIIAGQPDVRVTRSGNVVGRHHHVGTRIRNGYVPVPRHRLGPPYR